MRTRVPGPQLSDIELPQRSEILRVATPENVIDAVARRFNIEREQVLKGKTPDGREARLVGMWLLRAASHLTYAQIGSLLGGLGYGTVSTHLRRTKWQKELAEELLKEIEGHREGCLKSQT
jgi:chromosomal replication initiation ATPase DnaA